MENLLYTIATILTLICISSNIFIFSQVNKDDAINEDNKKYLTPLITINLIIFTLILMYIIYKYIKEENLGSIYKIFYIFSGLLTLAGMILCLIYIALRDKQDFVNKNFVKYILLYHISLLHVILIGTVIKKNECEKEKEKEINDSMKSENQL